MVVRVGTTWSVSALILLAVWAVAEVAVAVVEFDPRRHLATTTPYRPATPAPGSAPPETCRLHQVNMVLRHGTRYPTQGTVQLANRLYGRLQDVLAAAGQTDVNVPFWLSNWRPRFDDIVAGELTTSGMLEHYELAQRLAARYPDVFAQPYRADRCRLRSTQKSRAGRSASAFSIGLWHGTGDVTEHRFEPTFIYTTGPLVDDPILRPFDKCPRYERSLRDPETMMHYNRYTKRISPKIAMRIEQRFGLRLKPDLVVTVWKVAKAELSALGSSDLFKMFDEEDVLALELGDDIAAFWKKGPGREINWQMICPLLHDLLTSIFEASADGRYGQHRHLDLRFAHAETIIPLVTSLGLFQDNMTLTLDADPEQMRSRSWRMSHISPYAANVAFHLYRCGRQFLISILHNEEPVPIPFCSGQYYCPLKTFKSYLQQTTNCCNLTEICSLDDMPNVCNAQFDDGGFTKSVAFLATLTGLSLGTLTGFFLYKCNELSKTLPEQRSHRNGIAYRRLIS